MGRHTYEVGSSQGLLSPYPTLAQYVFSTTMGQSPHDDVTLVEGDAVDVVTRLKKSGKGDIWLCGGGTLAGHLLDAGLIDEITVKLNPIVFGKGIPMLAGSVSRPGLELESHQTFQSGHAILNYRVTRA